MAKHAFEDQELNPINAAKRLGIYLPAAPEDFQNGRFTRADLDELEKNPPAWLEDLRQNGPHPRAIVASRLGVSISGLARGGIDEPLTTQQINDLRNESPDWLIHERAVAENVRHAEKLAAEQDRAIRRASNEPN